MRLGRGWLGPPRAATPGTAVHGQLPLVAHPRGRGRPFLLSAAVYDRAPRLLAPLGRHGRMGSIFGGLLVTLIGVAMIFDWLALLPRFFSFNTAI